MEKTYTVEQKAITRTKDRVCIVGCADSKNLVPFTETDMEYWGVNNLYGVPLPGSHWDRWFEIHPIELGQDGRYRRRDDLMFRGMKVDTYMKQLGQMECPIIYMQHKWDIVPQSVEYPLAPVTDLFGRYFTNTISYEIALAIMMGYQEIQVYGVDMAVGSEYQHQRPSCEYFLGYATGRGIKIHIPDEADLLKSRFLYGFEETKRQAFEKKMVSVQNTMRMKREAVQGQLEALKAQINQYVGAEFGIGEMMKNWSNFDDVRRISS